MSEDCRPKTEDRRSASALAAVATRALPAMLSWALPLTVCGTGPAAASTVALSMRLTGSLSGSTLPLASEARGLTGRRTLRARRPATAATGGTMSVAVAFEAAAAASARLTNGEVRILPILRLALRARQRRANEATVHRPILVGRGGRNRFLIESRSA